MGSEALEFAQLYKLAPFVKVSTVSEMFHALIITDSQSAQNSLIEQCMWQLIENLGKAPDEAFFFTQLAPDFTAFKSELKTKIDLIEDKDDLAEKLPEGDNNELASLVDEGTGNFGVMLYFGNLHRDAAESSDFSHKLDLLNHCILSLKTVHHTGSAIIKLSDTSSLFCASLVFLMYQLFDKIAISKPYAGDFTTPD